MFNEWIFWCLVTFYVFRKIFINSRKIIFISRYCTSIYIFDLSTNIIRLFYNIYLGTYIPTQFILRNNLTVLYFMKLNFRNMYTLLFFAFICIYQMSRKQTVFPKYILKYLLIIEVIIEIHKYKKRINYFMLIFFFGLLAWILLTHYHIVNDNKFFFVIVESILYTNYFNVKHTKNY